MGAILREHLLKLRAALFCQCNELGLIAVMRPHGFHHFKVMYAFKFIFQKKKLFDAIGENFNQIKSIADSQPLQIGRAHV